MVFSSVWFCVGVGCCVLVSKVLSMVDSDWCLLCSIMSVCCLLLYCGRWVFIVIISIGRLDCFSNW